MKNPAVPWFTTPQVIQEGNHSHLFESPPQGIMQPASDYDGHSYPPAPLPYPYHSHPLTKALQRLVEPGQRSGAPGCLATTAEWTEVMQVRGSQRLHTPSCAPLIGTVCTRSQTKVHTCLQYPSRQSAT